MATTRFLSNAGLWREIREQVEKAKRVEAAIAYFATGGADLLKLQKGDRLLVDMSIGAMKQGATNPREIRRLMKRGVQVYTRASLHAKFILAGNTLITGSMNASQNSLRNLDEAGLLTNDPAAIRRARAFLERMCTEPVRSEYLKKCLEAYRPPKFAPRGGQRAKRRRRNVQAKVWFLGGIAYDGVPEGEEASLEAVQRRAARRHHLPQDSVVEIHIPTKEWYFDRLREGQDWVVCCARDPDSGTRYVEAPARFLGIDKYPRGNRKWRWVVLMERPANAGDMPLRSFRSRIRKIVPELDRKRPRTRPIAEDEQADAILRLWTHSGKIAKRR